MNGRVRIAQDARGWFISDAGLLIAYGISSWALAMSEARAWIRLQEMHTS